MNKWKAGERERGGVKRGFGIKAFLPRCQGHINLQEGPGAKMSPNWPPHSSHSLCNVYVS